MSATEQRAVSAAQAKALAQPREGGSFLRSFNNSLVTILVVVIAVLWSIPTFGLFISSFRPPTAIASTGWWTGLLPPWQFTLQNYVNVIQQSGMGQAFINSLIISIPATFFPILFGSFAAFAFAWMRFPFRNTLFFAVVAMLVIPNQIALAPILYWFTQFGLTGTYFSLWIAHTAFGLPFAVFLLRNFFAALPRDLIESAYIDGASNFRTFWTIIIPLSVPALASLAIFQFMWVWNDLLIALIFVGGTPTVAPMTVIVANLVGSYGENWQLLTAAAFLSMALPLVVFFSLQRYFIRGILAGSVKG
jgi:alpha-glucoside transport system permease protein